MTKKDIEFINDRQIFCRFIEKQVLNGYDIAPYLFKEIHITRGQMLDFINKYSDVTYRFKDANT